MSSDLGLDKADIREVRGLVLRQFIYPADVECDAV
jgi:hypothetical protein